MTRATSASTTGVLAWGQSFVYDPFGNLLQQNVTSGSAPAMNLTVDPNTNRITTSGFSYDAAGNLTASPGASGPNAFSYDSENRLSVANGLNYRYGSSGERLFDGANWHFYGPDGTHLGKLTQNTTGDPNWYDFSVELHFAGRLVWQNRFPVMTDRLGSVVQMSLRDGVNNYAYYPQGQWIANMPAPDHSLPGCWPSCGGALNSVMDVAFGTYHRDGYWSMITGSFVTRGLDYAQNRFYDPARGRFTTADPYDGSMDPSNPLSFNRYAYVMGDPINSSDPSGLCTIGGVVYTDGQPPCPDITSVTVPGGGFGLFGGGGGGGSRGGSALTPSQLGMQMADTHPGYVPVYKSPRVETITACETGVVYAGIAAGIGTALGVGPPGSDPSTDLAREIAKAVGNPSAGIQVSAVVYSALRTLLAGPAAAEVAAYIGTGAVPVLGGLAVSYLVYQGVMGYKDYYESNIGSCHH